LWTGLKGAIFTHQIAAKSSPASMGDAAHGEHGSVIRAQGPCMGNGPRSVQKTGAECRPSLQVQPAHRPVEADCQRCAIRWSMLLFAHGREEKRRGVQGEATGTGLQKIQKKWVHQEHANSHVQLLKCIQVQSDNSITTKALIKVKQHRE
jgi:hypothetical protein